jgi:hypothetical protein
MFSGNRSRVKGFLASFSVLVVLAGLLFGARVAAADSVWVQSYERTSQTQACVGQQGETTWQAAWGTDAGWTPSWEQWANNGKGGWTCTRSITWARTPAAGGSTPRTYALGDIGPGGGLVFLISDGLTYEMAPKTWGVNETTGVPWCSNTTSIIAGAWSDGVGGGSANTTAMQPAACMSGAGVEAREYTGGGFTDWFLPSKEELNAMCNYSRSPTVPAAPSEACYDSVGTSQNGTFAAGDYGFDSDGYWSSSQGDDILAKQQNFGNGDEGGGLKSATLRVRPIRSF